MFDLLVNPAWLMSFTRRYVFPYVANFLVGLESVNQFIFPLISQIGITYREHSLSVDTGEDFEIKAGDRMPYFLVDGKSVYDSLHAPRFHLLTFTNDVEGPEHARERIEHEFPNLVDYHVFPLKERVTEIFGTDTPFSVLLRPDNYIGFVSSRAPLAELRAYFEAIGRPQARSKSEVAG